MELVTLGVEVKTTGASAAAADLGKFTGAAKGAAGAADQFEDQLRRTAAAQTQVSSTARPMAGAVAGLGGMFSRNASAIQNTSFQLQDLIVQMSLGVPATRALGIQLPQLLGGFGPMGALIGVATGALLSFTPALFGASDGAEDLKDKLFDLDEVTERLNANLERARIEAGKLRLGVTDAAEVEILMQMERTQEQISALERERVGLVNSLAGAHSRAALVIQHEAEKSAEQAQVLREQLETLGQQYQGYKDALGILNNIEIRQNGIEAGLIAQWEETRRVAQGYSMIEVAAMDAARASAVAAASANQSFIPSSGLGTFPAGTGPAFERSGRMGSSTAPAPTILPTLDDIIAKYLEVGSAGSGAVNEIAEATEELTIVASDYASTIETELNGAFAAVLDGTATLGDALLDFASNVLEKIAQDLFAQQFASPIADVLGGVITGIVPSANGNVFNSGGLVPFAKGGVVSGPTVFPFANGTGLMGEAGPEAIMPLSRGAGGRLGVEASGLAPKIIINNFTSESASVASDGAGNVTVDIGKAVANDIASGGASYQAIKKTFGISPKLQLRG